MVLHRKSRSRISNWSSKKKGRGNSCLIKKFEENLKTQFSAERVEKIMKICEDQNDLESLNVTDFMEILIKE